MFERPAFARGWISDDPIDFSTLVALGEVFGNWHPVFADKKQAMAVFIDLHFIAGAYPPS